MLALCCSRHTDYIASEEPPVDCASCTALWKISHQDNLIILRVKPLAYDDSTDKPLHYKPAVDAELKKLFKRGILQ